MTGAQMFFRSPMNYVKPRIIFATPRREAVARGQGAVSARAYHADEWRLC